MSGEWQGFDQCYIQELYTRLLESRESHYGAHARAHSCSRQSQAAFVNHVMGIVHDLPSQYRPILSTFLARILTESIRAFHRQRRLLSSMPTSSANRPTPPTEPPLHNPETPPQPAGTGNSQNTMGRLRHCGVDCPTLSDSLLCRFQSRGRLWVISVGTRR